MWRRLSMLRFLKTQQWRFSGAQSASDYGSTATQPSPDPDQSN
jgi:hypothetical protein